MQQNKQLNISRTKLKIDLGSWLSPFLILKPMMHIKIEIIVGHKQMINWGIAY
jgi:hypothetical protein